MVKYVKWNWNHLKRFWKMWGFSLTFWKRRGISLCGRLQLLRFRKPQENGPLKRFMFLWALESLMVYLLVVPYHQLSPRLNGRCSVAEHRGQCCRFRRQQLLDGAEIGIVFYRKSSKLIPSITIYCMCIYIMEWLYIRKMFSYVCTTSTCSSHSFHI